MTNNLFSIELINEINLLRDNPCLYKKEIKSIKSEKDEKNNLISIYFKEGMLKFDLKIFSKKLKQIETIANLKIITIDNLLNDACKGIYKKLIHNKIKNNKIACNLKTEVYPMIESVIHEYGKIAGNVSLIIDEGNISPKLIVLYNLINSGNNNNESITFLNNKQKVFGCYQENSITVILISRYIIPKNQSNDVLSDGCVSLEEEMSEEIEYQDINIIEDPDMQINKEWSRNVNKVEKFNKIEEINGNIVKTIYVKKYLNNNLLENETIVKKGKSISNNSNKNINLSKNIKTSKKKIT